MTSVYFSAISVLFLSIGVQAQENSNYKKLIQETNAIYGSDDLLNSGELYRPEHTGAKGYPYFLTNAYLPATVSVRGNTFENVIAKYNIETDQFILLTPADTNSVRRIAIKQNWIDSFKIDKHVFVNIFDYDSAKILKGYYELVYRGKKSFLIKHTKRFNDAHNDFSANGYYSVLKPSFFIFDGIKSIPVKNKREFLELFSRNRAVKNYIRDNKIKFLKASTVQLNKLMQFCDSTFK